MSATYKVGITNGRAVKNIEPATSYPTELESISSISGQIHSYNQRENSTPSNTKSSEEESYNLDIIGLYLIAGFIFIIIGMRTLIKLKIQEKFPFLDVIYKWSNLAAERSFGASLPLYWLLRKNHSRLFTVRKIKQAVAKIGRILNNYSLLQVWAILWVLESPYVKGDINIKL